MFPGRFVGLAALLLLVVSVTAAAAAAAGGGVACGMFSELSCSEVATSEVGTLWTGAWSVVLGPGTSPSHSDSRTRLALGRHLCLGLSGG